MNILLVAKDFSRFSKMIERLKRNDEVQMIPASTGQSGLDQLKGKTTDVVVIDEQLDDMSGIEFAQHLVKLNPLVNTAIVGRLSKADFHEATEGLGVLMQLPPEPGEQDAEALLSVLSRIAVLINPTAATTGKV